jgi:hypothetical protein
MIHGGERFLLECVVRGISEVCGGGSSPLARAATFLMRRTHRWRMMRARPAKGDAMRNNPRLMFTLSLLLATAGGVTWIAATLLLPSLWDPDAPLWAKLVYGAGFLGIALGLILAVRPGLSLFTLRKLERGESVLAEWRVGPGDLARFRQADAARAALWPSLRNWLALPDQVPAAGLPVRIGKTGMLIGGDFHGLGTSAGAPTIGSLCEAALVDGEPAMLELTLGKGPLSDPTESRAFNLELRRPFWVMRVPVPAEARAAAARVVAHLDADIWRINRDWARLTYAEHFAIADRTPLAREAPAAAATPEPAWHDQSVEAQAYRAVANVFGIESARAPTRDSPAYRKAQAQFFGGIGGLAFLFGANTVVRFDSSFDRTMAIVWAVLFFIALGFTLRGAWGYFVKRGA